MKKLFSVKYSENLLNVWILIFRALLGTFMISHGLPKFQYLLSGQEILFPDPIGIGSQMSFMLIVFAEFFCAIFVIVGFGTRWSSIPIVIAMFVAAFVVHASDPFGSKEMALLYLIGFITLIITGGGKYSIDYLLSKTGKK